jgi:protein SCO1/2
MKGTRNLNLFRITRVIDLILLFIFLFSMNFCGKTSEKMQDVGVGGDFTLVGPQEKKWTLSQNSKKVNLVFFGYMSCPDFCPMTLSKLKQVNEILGEKQKNVQIIFVSVDSKRDSLDRLQTFVQYYVPNGIGVTGDKKDVDAVVKMYGASYSQNGQFIDHSTYLYLLDDKTKTRYLFRHADPAKKIAEIIQLLL